MPTPTAAPAVSSTVGLKNMVLAPLTADTEESTTYGSLQKVAGAIEASFTPRTGSRYHVLRRRRVMCSIAIRNSPSRRSSPTCR